MMIWVLILLSDCENKCFLFFDEAPLFFLSLPLHPHPLPLPDRMRVPKILTLVFSLCLVFHVIVARYAHTSVVLSDGSVLVMGGADNSSRKNDVWKTVNGGASWILVTSSAGWTGKKIIHLSNSLPLIPSLG